MPTRSGRRASNGRIVLLAGAVALAGIARGEPPLPLVTGDVALDARHDLVRYAHLCEWSVAGHGRSIAESRVTLGVNGRRTDHAALSTDRFDTARFSVPAARWRPGENTLEFRWRGAGRLRVDHDTTLEGVLEPNDFSLFEGE